MPGAPLFCEPPPRPPAAAGKGSRCGVTRGVRNPARPALLRRFPRFAEAAMARWNPSAPHDEDCGGTYEEPEAAEEEAEEELEELEEEEEEAEEDRALEEDRMKVGIALPGVVAEEAAVNPGVAARAALPKPRGQENPTRLGVTAEKGGAAGQGVWLMTRGKGR